MSILINESEDTIKTDQLQSRKLRTRSYLRVPHPQHTWDLCNKCQLTEGLTTATHMPLFKYMLLHSIHNVDQTLTDAWNIPLHTVLLKGKYQRKKCLQRSINGFHLSYDPKSESGGFLKCQIFNISQWRKN